MDARRTALQLAEELARVNKAKVDVGQSPPLDLVSAQAEVASNQEQLIIAETAVKQAEDRLRLLIFDTTDREVWNTALDPVDSPPVGTTALDLDAAVTNALRDRADLQRARGDEKASESTLRAGLRLDPRNAALHYALGLALLVAVALAGDIVNGARRWLHVGVTRFQPSEMMKIAMPLMLAWFFHRNEGVARFREFVVAGLLLAVPLGLIARQPDLGTALVIVPDGGDGPHLGLEDIGGVEPATETDFDDADGNIGLPEQLEPYCCCGFEECRGRSETTAPDEALRRVEHGVAHLGQRAEAAQAVDDEQDERRRGDEARPLAQVLARHGIGTAAARVRFDRLAIRRDDDDEQHGDRDRDRQTDGEYAGARERA